MALVSEYLDLLLLISVVFTHSEGRHQFMENKSTDCYLEDFNVSCDPICPQLCTALCREQSVANQLLSVYRKCDFVVVTDRCRFDFVCNTSNDSFALTFDGCSNSGSEVPKCQVCFYVSQNFSLYSQETDCLLCRDGRYGSRCEHECPRRCVSCRNSKTCGNCLNGFYGNTCENDCPKNCQFCSNETFCGACKGAFYGAMCDNPCPDTCASCADKETCTECNGGYYGDRCNLKCADKCTSCENKDSCTSCVDGYFGPKCQSSCPRDCVTCSNDGHCTSCKEGASGSRCENLENNHFVPAIFASSGGVFVIVVLSCVAVRKHSRASSTNENVQTQKEDDYSATARHVSFSTTSSSYAYVDEYEALPKNGVTSDFNVSVSVHCENQ